MKSIIKKIFYEDDQRLFTWGDAIEQLCFAWESAEDVETQQKMIEEFEEHLCRQLKVIICTDCLGTGKEICSNPDHGFRDAVGGVRLDGHANGCPCCGNDELHRIPNTTCNNCNGTGKL